ncbi:hypothetical protein GGS20DRAFT_536890 [Poronia punctata]|nr:hypothetical protein GGS20DRAFT_536890 [Poronia punctata]
MMMPGNEWELYKRQATITTTATAPTPSVHDNHGEEPGAFNHKPTVEALVITFTVIAWICVILRIWTRHRLRALGWDDLFVFIFRITGTAGGVFILLLFDNGLGKHYADIGKENQRMFQKKYYVALLAYTISTALMKLCLLSQYLRLFADDMRTRRLCWFFIALTSVWGLAFSVIALVPCVPIVSFWDWADTTARCYGFGSRVPAEISSTYGAHVTTNVLLDLIVLAIPIPHYFKTFKEKRQRVGFTLMILLGILVNLVSIWRLHVIIRTRAATWPVPDPTFYGPQSFVLAVLEVDLASIVASVPVFWPMLTQNWGKIFVTQEVHVTRHHRRLSGEDNFELHATNSSSRSPSRATSDGGSLKLVIQDTEGQDRGRRSESKSRSRSQSRAPEKKRYDMSDPYIRERVYPLDGGNMIMSEAQVISEGAQGFERNYREHFSPGVSLSQPASMDKLDGAAAAASAAAARMSTDHNRDRSWSISISRKSSQRFLN